MRCTHCVRRGPRLAALMAAVLLAGGVVAGCGDDSDESSKGADNSKAAESLGGKASCGKDTGKQATGAPIKVGAVVGKTGPADFSSAAQASRAYFACVNANGGIDGRPVKYIVEDDNWNPEKAAQVARKLVEDDKVVAMVGSTSFVECGANAGYYEKNNVLVIAGVGVPRECFHSRNIAPTNQGPRLSTIGAAQLAAEDGAKSLACVSNVIPNFGAWACDGVKDWGKENGVEVETFLGKPDASDAEQIALKALGAGTDAVVLVDAAPGMVPYLKVAEQQGSGGEDKPWYLPTSAYDITFPKTVGSYWNKKLEAQIELVEIDSTGPDNTAWQGVMAKYGANAPRDSFSQAGFLAAKIFTDTLQEIDGEVDRDTVTEALRAVENYETDLLCGPWYFGDAKLHNANHAGRAVLQTGTGKTGFETAKDCFEVEDPDLAPILSAEAG